MAGSGSGQYGPECGSSRIWRGRIRLSVIDGEVWLMHEDTAEKVQPYLRGNGMQIGCTFIEGQALEKIFAKWLAK